MVLDWILIFTPCLKEPLKPDIGDDRNLLHGDQHNNMLISECRSLVSPNADGVGATDRQAGTEVHGDSSNFLIRLLCPLNPFTPHSSHAVMGGVFGSQRCAASLCATDSLIVCL